MTGNLSEPVTGYQALDSYTIDSSGSRNWYGYAAAAGAGLAMAGAAEAEIIYSGLQNIVVQEPATPGFTGSIGTNIDIDGGGADFRLLLNFGTNWGFANLNPLTGVLAAHSGGVLRLRRFASASTIGTGVAMNGVAETLRGANLGFATTKGNWNYSTGGIAGFRLGSGEFGWIRLHVEDIDGDPLVDRVTAVDWAYEDTGAAILAGDTSSDPGHQPPAPIPVPASLSLLAAGAAGVTAMRRRKRGREEQRQ